MAKTRNTKKLAVWRKGRAQGELAMATTKPERRPRHGGFRVGAGRKRQGPRKRVRHAARPTTAFRFPVHVTKRVLPEVGRLRRFELCKVLRRAFVRGCRRDGFRICQFSIQGNHIHLIVEARDAASLARGIQGWGVRVARGLNRVLGRTGSAFEDRYHGEVIKTPRQMRAALCYVMQNARRHGERLGRQWNGIDPFSSAWWFDGWRDDHWRRGLTPADEPPVSPGGSWLLTIGWRRHGLLGVDEIPPARRRELRARERSATA